MGFIEEYGLVKYKQGKYKATGSCEVPGCSEYQAALMQYFRQIASKYPVPRAPRELIKPDGTRYVVNARGYMAKDGRLKVVIDHCHKHGWIRGVACNSCNTAVGHIENKTGPPMTYPGIERPDYASFIRRCPDCAREGPASATEHRWSPSPPIGTTED